MHRGTAARAARFAQRQDSLSGNAFADGVGVGVGRSIRRCLGRAAVLVRPAQIRLPRSNPTPLPMGASRAVKIRRRPPPSATSVGLRRSHLRRPPPSASAIGQRCRRPPALYAETTAGKAKQSKSPAGFWYGGTYAEDGRRRQAEPPHALQQLVRQPRRRRRLERHATASAGRRAAAGAAARCLQRAAQGTGTQATPVSTQTTR